MDRQMDRWMVDQAVTYFAGLFGALHQNELTNRKKWDSTKKGCHAYAITLSFFVRRYLMALVWKQGRSFL